MKKFLLIIRILIAVVACLFLSSFFLAIFLIGLDAMNRGF